MRLEAVYKDPRGRERSIDLVPPGLPSKSWAPSLRALQLMGLLNVLTLDGSPPTSHCGSRRRGRSSAAAPGGSTTSTSILEGR